MYSKVSEYTGLKISIILFADFFLGRKDDIVLVTISKKVTWKKNSFSVDLLISHDCNYYNLGEIFMKFHSKHFNLRNF